MSMYKAILGMSAIKRHLDNKNKAIMHALTFPPTISALESSTDMSDLAPHLEKVKDALHLMENVINVGVSKDTHALMKSIDPTTPTPGIEEYPDGLSVTVPVHETTVAWCRAVIGATLGREEVNIVLEHSTQNILTDESVSAVANFNKYLSAVSYMSMEEWDTDPKGLDKYQFLDDLGTSTSGPYSAIRTITSEHFGGSINKPGVDPREVLQQISSEQVNTSVYNKYQAAREGVFAVVDGVPKVLTSGSNRDFVLETRDVLLGFASIKENARPVIKLLGAWSQVNRQLLEHLT